MYAGEIGETGTALDIFGTPQHPYTKGLLTCIPVPGRTRPGEHLGSIPGIVPSLIGPLLECGFRERCSLAHEPCRRTVPLHRATPGHAVRCVLANRRGRESGRVRV